MILEKFEVADCIKSHAILPHMIAELSTLSMGRSNILLNVEVPDPDSAQKADFMREVEALGYVTDPRAHGSLRLSDVTFDDDGEEVVWSQSIVSSITSADPGPLEYILVDRVIDMDELERRVEEKKNDSDCEMPEI